jgi:hypothetical protein
MSGRSLGTVSSPEKWFAAGAFSFRERPPVLAQSFEPFKFFVIQLSEIAGGTVVQELEDLVHVFAPTLDNSLREKCGQRLQGLNLGDRNPLLAMSRRLGILCGARLGTCA